MILSFSERTFGSSPVLACSQRKYLVSSRWCIKVSARSLAEAGEENADGDATAEKTHDDPADNVVCGHEMSGRDLVVVVRVLVVLSMGNLSFVSKSVTGGELARGAESPDDTGDPPRESTAAPKASEESLAENIELTGNANEEEGEKCANESDHQLDETPSEPENEVAMDIGQGAVGVLDS